MAGLDKRARKLEEEAEYREQSRRIAQERRLREGLKRVSTAELEAMKEAFDRSRPEDWTEKDLPLMRRLLALVNEVRAEEEGVLKGEFPWQREVREREEQERGD